MVLDSLGSLVRSLGIPVGGVLIGLALGAGLFATAEWLRRRPSRSMAGTVRIRVVDGPGPPNVETGDPSTPGIGPVVAVPVTSVAGMRTLYLQGAGASPNAPLPRA